MSKNNDEILADRLNTEPPIFRGLSNSELGMVMKVGVVFWVPTCLFIAFLAGATMMGLGVAMIMLLITVLASGTILQRIKRGRPDYYFQHKIALRNVKNATRSDNFIVYTGTWEIGRVD